MAIWRITLRGTYTGKTVNLVRYWNDQGAFTANVQAFMELYGAGLATAYMPEVSNQMTWNDMYYSQATTGSLGSVYVPTMFPLTGALVTNDIMPPDVAGLSIYNGTALAYPRQNRNRICGIVEGYLTGGLLNASGITAMTNLQVPLTSSYTENGNVWLPVLWSDQYQTSNSIASVAVRAQTSTQRSRRS